MSGFQLLHQLPTELLQDILDRLRRQDLECLNLTSKWAYEAATPLIWRDTELMDCRTTHEDDQTDEHDDTPLIRKLLLFATKPWLASQVHELTHRCHLPPPAIFRYSHLQQCKGRWLPGRGLTCWCYIIGSCRLCHSILIHCLQIPERSNWYSWLHGTSEMCTRCASSLVIRHSRMHCYAASSMPLESTTLKSYP